MKAQFALFINTICPISEAAFEALFSCFGSSVLKKNEYFIKEGESAKQIGFLYQGILRAYFIDASGKEYNKQFFMAPSVIGAYTSLLTKEPNRISQQAMVDSQILVANYAAIEALYEQFHELERLGRKLAEYYFLEKEKKELEMALLDATERYLILRQTFPKIETVIPQYHISSYLGISPTQLSRIRKKLKDS